MKCNACKGKGYVKPTKVLKNGTIPKDSIYNHIYKIICPACGGKGFIT